MDSMPSPRRRRQNVVLMRPQTGRLDRWLLALSETVVPALLATVFIAFGAWLIWRQRVPSAYPLDTMRTVSECRASYAHARSALDSASIDRQVPISSKASAVAKVTCGELRRSGALETKSP
jgi:hypothetical protein